MKTDYPVIFMNKGEHQEAYALNVVSINPENIAAEYYPHIRWKTDHNETMQSNKDYQWSNPTYIELLVKAKLWKDIRKDFLPKWYNNKNNILKIVLAGEEEIPVYLLKVYNSNETTRFYCSDSLSDNKETYWFESIKPISPDQIKVEY